MYVHGRYTRIIVPIEISNLFVHVDTCGTEMGQVLCCLSVNGVKRGRRESKYSECLQQKMQLLDVR